MRRTETQHAASSVAGLKADLKAIFLQIADVESDITAYHFRQYYGTEPWVEDSEYLASLQARSRELRQQRAMIREMIKSSEAFVP